MILAGLHPNTTPIHVAIAKEALSSKQFTRHKNRQELEKRLGVFPGVVQAYALDSGRSALFLALKALNLPKGCAIGVSAYTCIVVRNAIIAAGYTPEYIDIDDSLGINPAQLTKHSHIKAIILQYTFGVIHKENTSLISWARKQGIPIIEDSAHLLDTFESSADIRIHSFGPEKPISAVRGGALLLMNDRYKSQLDTLTKELSEQPIDITKKLSRTQILFNKWRSSYPNIFTKIKISLYKKLNKTMPIVEPEEINGRQSQWAPTHIGEPNAAIAIKEIDALRERNTHRKMIAKVYTSILPNQAIVQSEHRSLVPLEIAVTVKPDPASVLHALAGKGIMLSRSWLFTPIVPRSSYAHLPKNEQTQLQSCSQAMSISKNIVTVPTHLLITKDDATEIATSLLPYV